jgi:hypothetical protein
MDILGRIKSWLPWDGAWMYPDVQMKKQGLLTALLAGCTGGVRVQQDWRPLNKTLLFILYCTVELIQKNQHELCLIGNQA